MPRPVQFCLFATVLLIAAAAIVPSARSEMTAADEDEMRTFITCLEQTVNNEERCLRKLGYQSWYPYGDAACESVVARIYAVLAANNQAEWESLFRNERCARLGLTHDTAAAKAGSITNVEEIENIKSMPYVSCEKETKDQEICLDRVGRHTWYPMQYSCHMLDDILEGDPQLYSWKLLFFNERCWRLGLPYIRPSEQ